MIITKQYKEDSRYFDNKAKARRYCKRCGHSQVVPQYLVSRACTYCGYPIYRNDRTEFEERLKKEMNKR